jgi:hypothetical protein
MSPLKRESSPPQVRIIRTLGGVGRLNMVEMRLLSDCNIDPFTNRVAEHIHGRRVAVECAVFAS